MSLTAASIASRAAQGGVALARGPWTPQDLDVLTGPRPNISLTQPPVVAQAAYYFQAVQAGKPWILGQNIKAMSFLFTDLSHPYQIQVGDVSQANDIYSALPTFVNSAGGFQIARTLSIARARFLTSFDAQSSLGANAEALNWNGLGKLIDCSGTSVDGIWPGTGFGAPTSPWTTVESYRYIGEGFTFFYGYPYGGTYPYTTTYAPGNANSNTGTHLTAAQLLTANWWTATGSSGLGPSSVVNNGQLIFATTGLGPTCYQVVTAGTLGVENPNTWPEAQWSSLAAGNLTQPFTSGTAQVICVGGGAHQDGVQTVNARKITLRNAQIHYPSNSCMLIQQANSGGGADNVTYDVPVQNWIVEDYEFVTLGTYDVYIQTQSVDTAYASSQFGGFTRTGTTWTNRTGSVWKSRPWHISFRRGKHLTQVPPLSPLFGGRANTVPTFPNVCQCYGAIVVRSEAIRDAGIAAQYGWTTDDSRLAQMRAGTFDWSTPPTPDSTILEARYQGLLTQFSLGGASATLPANPGVADARTWIVWEPSIYNDHGTLLTPSTGGAYPTTGKFDSQGYYIGN